MSSLAVMPDPRQQLADLARENENLRRELFDTKEALREERARNEQGAAGAEALRRVLSPLYTALQRVFGEMDALGVAEGTSGHVEPRKAAVWEAWKTKLPGIPAKMIDALLVHGALNQTQLRIHAQCARSSVPNAVMALNRAGLINKSGDGKISLKEL